MYRGTETPQCREDGDPNEEVTYSRDPKIVNYSWTKEATRLLIGIRSQLDAEFDDPNQRKMDLWEKISLTLKEHRFDFPPSICDKKWRNLLVSFRRTVSRGTQGKLGRFPYTWEFYDDLLGYWQKKDPIAVRDLTIAAPNGDESFHENDENFDEAEFDSFQEDNYEEEEPNEDNGDDAGDLNKFLSVTLTESDDDPSQENHCVIERRGEIEIRPHSLSTPKVENLEISPVPYSPKIRQTDSPPPLTAKKYPLEIKQVSNNSRLTKFRPTPTITIEEVQVRPPKRKQQQEDFNDLDNFHYNANNSQLNISYKNEVKPEESSRIGISPMPKLQRREQREADNSPRLWVSILKSMEESAQKRWEVTEARQIREYKQKRELDLQLLQTMQNLSSVLVKMTEEA